MRYFWASLVFLLFPLQLAWAGSFACSEQVRAQAGASQLSYTIAPLVSVGDDPASTALSSLAMVVRGSTFALAGDGGQSPSLLVLALNAVATPDWDDPLWGFVEDDEFDIVEQISVVDWAHVQLDGLSCRFENIETSSGSSISLDSFEFDALPSMGSCDLALDRLFIVASQYSSLPAPVAKAYRPPVVAI